jgi:hypothetical protein
MMEKEVNPFNYSILGTIIEGYKTKYKPKLSHTLISKMIQNSLFVFVVLINRKSFEMDALIKIFNCELSIGSYKFKESIFAVWEVIHVLKSWNLWYVRGRRDGDSGKNSPNMEKSIDVKETQKSFKKERKSPFKKKEHV